MLGRCTPPVEEHLHSRPLLSPPMRPRQCIPCATGNSTGQDTPVVGECSRYKSAVSPPMRFHQGTPPATGSVGPTMAPFGECLQSAIHVSSLMRSRQITPPATSNVGPAIPRFGNKACTGIGHATPSASGTPPWSFGQSAPSVGGSASADVGRATSGGSLPRKAGQTTPFAGGSLPKSDTLTRLNRAKLFGGDDLPLGTGQNTPMLGNLWGFQANNGTGVGLPPRPVQPKSADLSLRETFPSTKVAAQSSQGLQANSTFLLCRSASCRKVDSLLQQQSDDIDYDEHLWGDPWDGCEDLKRAGLLEWHADLLRIGSDQIKLDAVILLQDSPRTNVGETKKSNFVDVNSVLRNQTSSSAVESTDADSWQTSPSPSTGASTDSIR